MCVSGKQHALVTLYVAATEYLARSLRREVFLLAHSRSSQSILARTHCGRGQGTAVADVGVSSQRMDWDINAGALLICLFPLVWPWNGVTHIQVVPFCLS